MNASSIGFGIGMLALGVGIGWVIKPQAEVEQVNGGATSVNSEPSAGGGSSLEVAEQAEGPARAKEGGRGTDERISATEAQQLEQKKQIEEYKQKQLEKQREASLKKIEARMKELVEELSLNPEEAKLLKDQLLADLEERTKLIETMSNGDPSKMGVDAFLRLAELAQPSQVNQRLADLLDGEAKLAFEAKAQRERDQLLESQALGELAKLQVGLDLTDAQKDAVYAKLHEEKSSAYDEPNASAGFKAMVGDEMSVFMDDDMVEIMSGSMFGAMEMAEQEGKELEELGKPEMGSVIDQRIEASVKRFEGIFTEAQAQDYRRQLEQRYAPFKGMMDFKVEE